MKELTCQEWKKNPTPRMMWCWNSSERDKVKRKVIHILLNYVGGGCIYPVLSVTDDDSTYETYKHCAEIEEPETEEPETKSSKGFYVYNRSGSKPSYIHETLEAAKEEAERIFNLNLKSNIKEPLEVLEIVARYTPKVTAEWE